MLDSTTGQSAEDRAAYNLIMKDKERLLSFEEPVAFIFSHSALREGWDNPNVCQICTLNQTVSEVKKRQEVGRGMRLVVNQQGLRVLDDKAERADRHRQRELRAVRRRRFRPRWKRRSARKGRPPGRSTPGRSRWPRASRWSSCPQEFDELWERIKHKTPVSGDGRYGRSSIADVVAALDKLKIDPPRIISREGRRRKRGKARTGWKPSCRGQGVLATLIGRQPCPTWSR